MNVGVPKETREDKKRAALLPVGANALVESGHTVFVEQGASLGAGVSDDEYIEAGAVLVDTSAEVFAESELIVKVKDPSKEELAMIREDHVVFAFFHFAANNEMTRAFSDTGAVAIAYETVEDSVGNRPLLMPMSEIAGRMSIQVGAHFLERANGGRGVLLGGVPGVNPADVVIIGGGIVGRNAARMAYGIGAHVTILDRNPRVLQAIDDQFNGHVNTIMSHASTVEAWSARADLLVGAVLVPGAAAPRVLTAEHVAAMKEGSVIVDVAVDQGGCIETTRGTTHADPTFVVDGVVHYGVTNMPGAVPRTSTFALTNVTTPYLETIASKGAVAALADDPDLASGVNTYQGKVTCEPVAAAQAREYTPLQELL